MKILFGREHFSAGMPWEGLARFLPEHEIIACSSNTLVDSITDADVVVPFGSRVDRALIERGRFGLIQQFGVGLDTVDIPAATRAGVWVARLPASTTGNADSVAEHAIMQMLMLSRKLEQVRTAWQEGRWAQPPGIALVGKVACILGLGDIGAAVARRLHAFGMTLVGVRKNPALGAPADLPFRQIFGPQALHEALQAADYVIVCINYTPESHAMLNAAAFHAMKPGAFVINIARGGLIDHDALMSSLDSGHVAGAGLDVFWEEPVALGHPLFRYNVVATPHLAGVTDVFYTGGARAFAENIERYARGEQPRHVANQIERTRYP
jgi:phosphoglycerate dehydrogenase-like enzyme